MEPLNANLERIVAEWAPLASVVTAIDLRAFQKGYAPGLQATIDIFLPAAEAACHFDMVFFKAVEGETPRMIGFDDICVSFGHNWPPPPCWSSPFPYIFMHYLRVGLLSEIPDVWKPDPKNSLFGPALAATGIPLEVFQALWAIERDENHYEALYLSWMATLNEWTDIQGDYLADYKQRRKGLWVDRKALGDYVFERIRKYITYRRRRHTLALFK
jgi:hypothetical protein